MIVILALTFDDYLKGVKNHPQIKGYESGVRVYSGRVITDLLPPNPTLTYNAMFMPGAISLDQPIPLSWPIKSLSSVETKRSMEYYYLGLENEFLFMAINSYLDALYLHEKIRVLEEILKNLQSVYKSVSALYKVGKIPESELKRIEAKMNVIRADIEGARGELLGKMKLVEYFYGKSVDSLEFPPVDTLPNLESLLKDVEKSPYIKSQYHAKRSSNYNRLSSILSLVPVLSPGILYNNGTMSFSISFEIPLWLPKYFGDLKGSQSEYKMQEYIYQSVKLRVNSEVYSEYEAYVSSLGRLKSLEMSLKELEKAYSSELSKYKTTGAGTTDYLFIQNDILETELAIIKEKLEVIRRIYRVKSLLGTI